MIAGRRRYTSRPCTRAIDMSQELQTIIDLIRYGASRFNAAGLTFGHSYDNALAETIIGLFKTEVIYQDGPWRGLEHVEYATLEWVSWYNTQRLMEPLGYLPPAEYEAQYHTSTSDLAELVLK